MILDIPQFKCFVKSEYVTNNTVKGEWIEAYCFAVTIIESRTLLWTVHLIDGPVYSRLPTKAIVHKIPEAEATHAFDVFGSISSHGQVIAHQYLKDYKVYALIDGREWPGTYKFTIDYFEGGFAQDPEQHKTSNVIFMDSGFIFIGPNNMCLFHDTHFTNAETREIYRRNSRYYYIE